MRCCVCALDRDFLPGKFRSFRAGELVYQIGRHGDQRANNFDLNYIQKYKFTYTYNVEPL